MVATLALRWSDRMIWGERPPDAGYVHRRAVHWAVRRFERDESEERHR